MMQEARGDHKVIRDISDDDDMKYKMIDINRGAVRDTKIAEALAARQRPLSSRISFL